MTRHRIPIIIVIALSVASGLEACDSAEYEVDSVPTSEREATAEPLLPAGTEIAIELTDNLSTTRNRTGDDFSAIVARDVNASNFVPLIRAGSRARGTVTLARPRRGKEPAVLAIRVDAVHADGHWLPVHATAVSADLRRDTAADPADTTATIAVGTAVTALLERVLSDDSAAARLARSPGPGHRAGIALVNSRFAAAFLEGSRLRLRLDAPLGRR